MAEPSKFNSLLQLVFTGYRSFEWMPIFVARFLMEVFFCVSGYNKLFITEKHEDLIKLMAKIGLPFPDLLALFFGSVKFFGGIFLMIRFRSTLCTISLTIAMIVAIVTVEIDLIIPKGIGFFDWMSWFLYLP
jgi:putative oxidoreductase